MTGEWKKASKAGVEAIVGMVEKLDVERDRAVAKALKAVEVADPEDEELPPELADAEKKNDAIDRLLVGGEALSGSDKGNDP